MSLDITRRRAAKTMACAAAVSAFGSRVSAVLAAGSKQVGATAYPEWCNGMPPVYCLAYIDPNNPKHQNQDDAIARFPMALVPQDDRGYFKRWREGLRNKNSKIRLLAYICTIEETDVPGPGHRAVRPVTSAWVRHLGVTPTVDGRRRIYDPRNKDWQDAFVRACVLTMNSDAYEGIFLDQCSVFTKAAPIPSIFDEMKDALEQTLVRVREQLPNAILIGNSRYSWAGLNGEMNEGRPEDLAKEVAAPATHVRPFLNLFHHYIKEPDLREAESLFRLALKNRCFYGCCVNAQTIGWYDFFDSVLAELSGR